LQVIIDSQPLTVAVLASLLFGESIGAIGVGGLVLGVVGLLLLEVCLLPTLSSNFSYAVLTVEDSNLETRMLIMVTSYIIDI